MITDILARYWAKVDRQGPDDCWHWTGARTAGGYGQLSNGRLKQGKAQRSLATHISLAIDGRSRPTAKHVAMHRCDNPLCVNPAHLKWGTLSENTADMIAKGRSPAQIAAAHAMDARAASLGRKGNAKLNSEQVAYVRNSEKTTGDLARELHVTWQCIDNIRKGRVWRDNSSNAGVQKPSNALGSKQ